MASMRYPGANYYEQQYQERMVKHLKKKVQALSFNQRCGIPHPS